MYVNRAYHRRWGRGCQGDTPIFISPLDVYLPWEHTTLELVKPPNPMFTQKAERPESTDFRALHFRLLLSSLPVQPFANKVCNHVRHKGSNQVHIRPPPTTTESRQRIHDNIPAAKIRQLEKFFRRPPARPQASPQPSPEGRRRTGALAPKAAAQRCPPPAGHPPAAGAHEKRGARTCPGLPCLRCVFLRKRGPPRRRRCC